MGAAVARRAHKASWVGLAGLQYLCLTCSESYDRATDRRASAEWFLTQLAKVGQPLPLSLSKPIDNKWKFDYIYYKQYVVNHSLGLELERRFRLQRHWIITLVICFKIKLFGSLFPWTFPASFYWRNKMAFHRGRIAKGQKGGTERLGSGAILAFFENWMEIFGKLDGNSALDSYIEATIPYWMVLHWIPSRLGIWPFETKILPCTYSARFVWFDSTIYLV